MVASDRGHVRRRFQIGCRDRHAEVDALTALDGAMHRLEIGQVADDNLGAELAQALGAFVFTPHQRAHLVALGQQHGNDVAADGTDVTGSTGDQDGTFVRDIHDSLSSCALRGFRGRWRYRRSDAYGAHGSSPRVCGRSASELKMLKRDIETLNESIRLAEHASRIMSP